MRLSNKHQKLITSLSQKKYRQKHQLFIAEGVKVVEEFLKSSYELEILFSTDSDFSSLDCFIQVSYQELKKMSYDERILKYNLNLDRADVILPALEIYLKALKWSGASKVYVPKIGLSDGMIKDMYKKYNA